MAAKFVRARAGPENSRYINLAMNFPITSALALGALGLTVFFGWRGARRSLPGRTRLAPWRFLMLLAFTALIAMAVHLVTLGREDTGRGSAPTAFTNR